MSRRVRQTGDRPTIGMRSDHMGIAVVSKLSPTSAVLSNTKFNFPILATPKETYNDATLDLTEKLSRNMKVVYKSCRTTGETEFKAVAVYIRPYNECITGEAAMTEIRPTLGYAYSPVYGSIFFPVSAIEEDIINEPFMRRYHDLSKCLRIGDCVTFVAVSDESTKGRSAYAVCVNFAFNQTEGKPMLGIITGVKKSSINVWAKNFPPLTFKNGEDFGVDWRTDLREIFTEGDRVRFAATSIGCDIDGISNAQAADQGQEAKLSKAREILEKEDAEYQRFHINSVQSPTEEMFLAPAPIRPLEFEAPLDFADSNSVYQVNAISNSANCVVTCNVNGNDKDVLGFLEEELELDYYNANSNITDTLASSLNMNTPTDKAKTAESINAYFPDGPTTFEVSKKTADAEVQVRNLPEEKALNTLLEDSDIFDLACQRYPEIVRDVLRVRRNM